MNRAKRNVVVVGFTDSEKNCLAIPYDNTVHYVNNLSEATHLQGYLIVIDNSINKSITEVDKKYRKTLNRFELIWLYNEKYKGFRTKKDKWSRIEKVNRDLFKDGYSAAIEWNDYKYSKEHEKNTAKRINKDKSEQLKLLHKYTQKYKTRKTIEIKQDLKLNTRSIQRYMNDLNYIYHNIGYDYSLNEWYFIK